MIRLISSSRTLQFRPASNPYLLSTIELYVDFNVLSVELKTGVMSEDIFAFIAANYVSVDVALLKTGVRIYFLVL